MEPQGGCVIGSLSLRLLALITDGFGSRGGIAQYNFDLVNALSCSASIKQVVALPRFGNGSSSPTEKVLQLDAISSAYRWAVKAADLALRGGFDAIFCGHMNAVPFVARLARLSGKPLWVQAHGIEAWEDRGPKFRRALAQARLVTAVSRYTRKRFLSWADISQAKVRVLPNTFDQTYVPIMRRADLIARYGLGEKKVILTVGRMSSFERYKGHDRVIGVLEAVRSAVPNATYLIVGTGDDQPRLHALARKLDVADSVVFAGHVPAEQLADHYGLADVFAMPSTGEGFGIVFLEAAAAGLPVIGGDKDGSADALADGAIGMTVDPDDRNALTQGLIDALQGGVRVDPQAVVRFRSEVFTQHVDQLVLSISNGLRLK